MDNWREAHLRLSSTLPSRVHDWEPGERPVIQRQYRKGGVIVKGRKYLTMRQCCQNLKISPRTLYDWLDKGWAEYV